MKVLWHFNGAFCFTLLYLDSCFSHLPPSPHSTPLHRSVPPLSCSLLWSAVLVSLSQYGCPDSRGRWRSGINTGGRKSQRQVWQSHLDSYGKVWRANNNNEEVWSRGGCRRGWESPRETSKRRHSCFTTVYICIPPRLCKLKNSPSIFLECISPIWSPRGRKQSPRHKKQIYASSCGVTARSWAP